MADERIPETALPPEGEPLPEEVPPEVIPEEGAPPAEEAAPAGTVLTIEQFPELSGLNPGDTITFSISDVSEDGNSYTVATVGEVPAPPEEVAAAGVGQEEIRRELLGV